MCGLRGFIRTPWLFVLHGVQVCAPDDIDRVTPGGDTTFFTIRIVLFLNVHQSLQIVSNKADSKTKYWNYIVTFKRIFLQQNI